MVVMCHAGVVEEAGVHGVAGILDSKVFGLHVLDGLAGYELVELLYHQFLVGRPCYRVACWAEEAGHTVALEGGVVGA